MCVVCKELSIFSRLKRQKKCACLVFERQNNLSRTSKSRFFIRKNRLFLLKMFKLKKKSSHKNFSKQIYINQLQFLMIFLSGRNENIVFVIIRL